MGETYWGDRGSILYRRVERERERREEEVKDITIFHTHTDGENTLRLVVGYSVFAFFCS